MKRTRGQSSPGCAYNLGNFMRTLAANNFTSEIGKIRGPPLARMPLNGEVLAFDIAQPASEFARDSPLEGNGLELSVPP